MRRIFGYTSILILAVSLGSCSLLKKENTVKEESFIPQDREAIQKVEKINTFKPEEFSRGVVKGDWAIEEVFGKKAVGEQAPYLKFSQFENRVYGNNGCNTVNADYKYSVKDSTLTFSNVLTTMRLCAMEGITEREINQALNETRYYTIVSNDDYYFMKLFNKSHDEIMVLMHQNFAFLNGAWKVVKIEDEPIDNPEMLLVFDVDEKKVHGNTGCNVLNGKLETDMDAPNSISISNMGVTLMMCPDLDKERLLLIALEDANKAKPINSGEVQLLNSDDKVVLILKRMNN